MKFILPVLPEKVHYLQILQIPQKQLFSPSLESLEEKLDPIDIYMITSILF